MLIYVNLCVFAYSQVMDASDAADMAKDEAQMAFNRAQTAKNESESSRDELQALIERIRDFLTQSGARPADIRAVSRFITMLEMFN